MTPPTSDRGEDQWVWGLDSKGKFTIKSAYNMLQNSNPLNNQWSSVWCWRGVVTPIGWELGPPGWTVLNSDGSVLQPSGKAAAGGLIRDELGGCSAAYSLNLGICSITRAELRGFLFGLQLAWELGHRRVVAQIDSAVAVALLEDVGDITHQHAAEVFQFRELLNRDWSVRIRLIYREANKAADSLAGRGHRLGLGNHFVPSSDSSLGFFLRYDCIGITENRLISINS
ncbi:Putative ribonuclease H protein At1g65750 [Linum perenne]